MNEKLIALGYCEENSHTALHISGQLAVAGLAIKNIGIQKDASGNSLFQQLEASDMPVILLVTDNFLRCVGCLYGAHRLVQNQTGRFFFIVADGNRISEENGEIEIIPTHFEKIGEIIKYLNYWQQRHIDFRKQQRQEGFDDEHSFNEHVRQVKEISLEIGELLRMIKTGKAFYLKDLQQNNYQQLFDFLGVSAPSGFSADNTSPTPATPTLPEEVYLAPPEVTPPSPTPEPEMPQEDEQDVEIDNLLDEILEDHYPTPEAEAPIITATPEADPQEVVAAIVRESEQLAFQGKSEENLALLTKAVAEYPNAPELRYQYALTLVQDNFDAAEAGNQLLVLLQTHPEHADALLLLGELYELQGKFGEARATYERLTAVAPAHAEGWFRLGKILQEHFPDQLPQAAHCFHKALDHNPALSEAHYELGNMAVASGDLETAEDAFQKTLEKDAGHLFAWYDLALLLHRRGDAEAAYSAYQHAVRNNPELKTPQNDMSFEYHRQLRTGKAAEIMEREQTALAEMRENLNRLEALLREREEELERLLERTNPDQTVLITGATSGIGKATAVLFAEKGYRLILTGRRPERLEELKSRLENDYQVKILTYQLDVRDAQAVKSFISGLSGDWATIDILINNAGKAKGLDPIFEGEERHWDEMIDTNIKGLLYVTRAVSPQMVARRSGHIINVCSTAGKETYPKGNVYCATKFAVDALTKSMRQDLYTHNVRVSQVSPAHVEETEFALVRFDGNADKAKIYEDFKPLNARDVAEAIYFLASRPNHVDVLDIVMGGTQQASAFLIDRSGRNA